MKKSVIAVLALSSLLMAGSAAAQLATDVIGIFGDPDAVTCQTDWTAPYQSVSVYFIAKLNTIGTMSACEFGATGVSQADTGALAATQNWDTPLVIGDIFDDGVALAFTTPLAAPLAFLGQIDYIGGDPSPAADHAMSIVNSGAGNLVVVDADTAEEITAEGWDLIVNCTVGGLYGDCSCEEGIATEDAAWGQIKALY